ncbi:MAG: Fe-S cluster assembly protein SufD [Planctomycetes bacterium]|nr:Fe-S cluster assembly protein SufD [Planctomycetota bacterium]
MSIQTVSAAPTGFDEPAFESFLDGRDEPRWLSERRREAFAAYQDKLAEPLDPEEWKRVDLRTFRPEQFLIRAADDEAPAAEVDTLLADRAEFAGNVVHIDGNCSRSRLDESAAAQGVLFGDLSELIREHGDVLQPHLMTRGVRPSTDRFSAWHAAFFTGGTLLYVPAGVELKAPLHSLIALSQPGAADFSHTLVVLEDGAQATLLEETASADADAPGLHVGAVELLLGRQARLRYVQLQNWNQKTYHFAHQSGRAAADASLQWTVGGLGARLAHIHQDVHLDGRGAEAEVNGVTFAVNRQLISYYTQQTHAAPDTRSDLLYKEVLRDKSRVVWRGMIRVEREAQRIDGFQRSDALLLSPDARCDSIPGLEIEADDVRCTHAATAGRVDEEEIFYCMSRGLSRQDAMHMIVGGFFHAVYDRIPVQAVRDTLSDSVERKLGIGGS